MRALRKLLDRIGKPFHPGGRLERFYPLYEAADTFFYSPAKVTTTGAHVRDLLAHRGGATCRMRGDAHETADAGLDDHEGVPEAMETRRAGL